MLKKSVFVPKPGAQYKRSGLPKALLGRIFIALSIGVVFLAVLTLIWRQNAQPPIGDEQDAGKPKVFREIPKTTVPEPQVLSLDKAPALEPSASTIKQTVTEPEPETSALPTPSKPILPLAKPPQTVVGKTTPSTDSSTSAPVGSIKTASPSQNAASVPQKASTVQEPTSSWVYAVQVGAYSKKENAQGTVERLKKMGLSSQISPFSHPKMGTLYAVRIAPFTSQAEAQKAAEKIASVEKEKPIIVKVPANR